MHVGTSLKKWIFKNADRFTVRLLHIYAARATDDRSGVTGPGPDSGGASSGGGAGFPGGVTGLPFRALSWALPETGAPTWSGGAFRAKAAISFNI